jgi:hypothetical protein
MFDQAQRSLWLEDQLWPKLKAEFPTISYLPGELLITVGYPSSGARGRSEKIRPAEFSQQWTGNPNEKMFVSVHPNYWTTPRDVAKALLFGAAKRVNARWGPSGIGLDKQDDGSLTEISSNTTAKLDKILADVGEPPAGFGIPFQVREVQRTRLELYKCVSPLCADNTRHGNIRAAASSGTVRVALRCQDCGSNYLKA